MQHISQGLEHRAPSSNRPLLAKTRHRFLQAATPCQNPWASLVCNGEFGSLDTVLLFKPIA
jgi:hypothetical protein